MMLNPFPSLDIEIGFLWLICCVCLLKGRLSTIKTVRIRPNFKRLFYRVDILQLLAFVLLPVLSFVNVKFISGWSIRFYL